MPKLTAKTKKIKVAKKTVLKEKEKKTAKAVIIESLEPVVPVIKEDIEAKEEKEQPKKSVGPERYFESVGRRKEAVARARLYTKKSTDTQESDERALLTVNEKPYLDYFRIEYLRRIVESPFKKLKSINRFKASVIVSGGGMRGQADAIRLALSRALIVFDKNFSKKLRRAGYVTVDARVKERRKYGLKKARKAPQWSKR